MTGGSKQQWVEVGYKMCVFGESGRMLGFWLGSWDPSVPYITVPVRREVINKFMLPPGSRHHLSPEFENVVLKRRKIASSRGLSKSERFSRPRTVRWMDVWVVQDELYIALSHHPLFFPVDDIGRID